MTKPTRTQSIGGKAARHGFSLLELLVVLAVLALTVGLSWPAVQKPWRKSRLQSAARQLQSELAATRTRAIETAAVLQLRHQPGTGRFAVREAPVIGAAAEITDGAGAARRLDAVEIEELHIKQLPDGVFFADIQSERNPGRRLDGPPQGRDGAASDLQTVAPGQLPWSEPIWFYPNGRVSGGRFTLAGNHGYYVDVTLRGLTATACIGRVLRREKMESQIAETNNKEKMTERR